MMGTVVHWTSTVHSSHNDGHCGVLDMNSGHGDGHCGVLDMHSSHDNGHCGILDQCSTCIVTAMSW